MARKRNRQNKLQLWLRTAVEEYFGRRGDRTGKIRMDVDGGGATVCFPERNRYGLHKVRYNHSTLWQIAGAVYGLEKEAVQKRVLELYQESFPSRKSKAKSDGKRSKSGSGKPTTGGRKRRKPPKPKARRDTVTIP